MLAEFALLLILGISLMWSLMPRRDVTAGFFRIQMLLVLGLTALAGLALGRFETEALASGVNWLPSRMACVVLGLAAYVGSIVWTLDRRVWGDRCVYLVLAAAAVAVLGARAWPDSWQHSSGWLRLAAQFSTAAVLGAAVTGMLLGHWYLTAPTMSIAPLGRLNQLLGNSLLLRIAVSLVAWLSLDGARLASTHWTWLALRWVGGLLAPLVLVYMVTQILRYRNTQAATGVLFAGVILVFLGEMSAALLFRELLVPL